MWGLVQGWYPDRKQGNLSPPLFPFKNKGAISTPGEGGKLLSLRPHLPPQNWHHMQHSLASAVVGLSVECEEEDGGGSALLPRAVHCCRELASHRPGRRHLLEGFCTESMLAADESHVTFDFLSLLPPPAPLRSIWRLRVLSWVGYTGRVRSCSACLP